MSQLPPAVHDAAANITPVDDEAAWLRRQIATVRSDVDDLIRAITWAPGYGRCCQHLQLALQNLKDARDASHHVHRP